MTILWKKRKLLALMPILDQVKTLSKDARTKIGAMIIDEEYNIRTLGYNSFPRGIDDTVEARQVSPEKYYWFEHAERNAIFNAVWGHTDIRDCWMLLTCDMPCCDCARAIINAKQKGIILIARNHTVVSSSSKSMWDEHAIRSKQMFKEAGKEVLYLEDMN